MKNLKVAFSVVPCFPAGDLSLLLTLVWSQHVVMVAVFVASVIHLFFLALPNSWGRVLANEKKRSECYMVKKTLDHFDEASAECWPRGPQNDSKLSWAKNCQFAILLISYPAWGLPKNICFNSGGIESRLWGFWSGLAWLLSSGWTNQAVRVSPNIYLIVQLLSWRSVAHSHRNKL